jgi:hypothetical protein
MKFNIVPYYCEIEGLSNAVDQQTKRARTMMIPHVIYISSIYFMLLINPKS